MTRRFLAGLFAFSVIPFAVTRTVVAQPAPPQLTAPVNDFASVMDAASEAELDRRIRALQAGTGDVVAVATVPTFKPYADIREYGVKMFENGGKGVGQKGKDNGLLIVVAIEDRRVDIEVGYDLEEFITDGFAGETIRQGMTPEFRAGNYGRGLVEGTTRIINRIAERRGVTLEDVPRMAQPTPVRSRSNFPWILLFWIFIMIMMNRRRGGRRRRQWGGAPWSGWSSGVGPFGGGGFGGGFGGFGGGGGGGGGFGGFGGGRSGGGGASGSW